MPDTLLYISCGMAAGLVAGYLGLGGGIVMVPFLTLVAGVDFRTAVPVSVTTIVVNSFVASNEYLKRGMVDLKLVTVLAIFVVTGNIIGAYLIHIVPVQIVKSLFTLLLIYTAVSLLKDRKINDRLSYSDNRGIYIVVCVVLALLTGVMAGLLGVGGGVILVPVLYLIIGLPLSTARGTTSLLIGFSAAASATVYLLNGMIDSALAAPVILGAIIGSRLGGYLGTRARPKVVRVVFFLLMIYMAYRLSYDTIIEML